MSQDVQVPWCKCQWIPCRATQSRSVSKKMPWQRQSSWKWPLGWSGQLYPWGSCYCFQSIKRTKESVSLFNQNSWKFSHCPTYIRGIWQQGFRSPCQRNLNYATVTGHFVFVVRENSVREIAWWIWHQKFLLTRKWKADTVNFLRLEECFQITLISWYYLRCSFNFSDIVWTLNKLNPSFWLLTEPDSTQPYYC